MNINEGKGKGYSCHYFSFNLDSSHDGKFCMPFRMLNFYLKN